MSELNNVNSIATNKQGEFNPGVKPSAPLETHGHKPGVKTSQADNVPEFHAQTFPPGTAPRESSYHPHTETSLPSQANNDLMSRGHGKENTRTYPEDTLTGATTQDVHRGLGHPGSGQTRTEIRHEGAHHRTKQSSGLEGVGTSREEKYERTLPDQRGIEREGAVTSGHHGDKGALGAENIQPTQAEHLASER